MATKKTAKKKTTRKKSAKKGEVIDILQGSTSFKMEVSLVILRFEPKFFVKFLEEIAEDVDKGRVLQISQGTSAVVLLCEESLANEIKKKYKNYVIDIQNDLVAYTIMFPKKAIKTPGVLYFIAEKLAKNGVNVIEVLSNYTEITFLISRKDLFKVMDTLGQFIV